MDVIEHCTCEHTAEEMEAAASPWHRLGCPQGHEEALREINRLREQKRRAVEALRLVRVPDEDFEGDDDLHVGVLLTRAQAAAIRSLLDGGR